MIPSYEIKNMKSGWDKAIAYTQNFIEEIENAPFSEDMKRRMTLALKCNIESLRDNNHLRKALQDIADLNFTITLPDRMDAVRKIAKEALQ